MPHDEEHYSSDPLATSESMLGEMRGGVAHGWWRLANQYSSLIFGWARHAGLQDSDAFDVLQEVLLSVYRKIGDFEHEPRRKAFRSWLWAITRHKIHDLCRRQANAPRLTGSFSGVVQSRRLLPKEPEEFEDRVKHTAEEVSQFLEGLKTIRDEFSEQTWQAFWRTAVNEVPAVEVADELGMTAGAVRTAKHRVLRRLRSTKGATSPGDARRT